MYRSQTEQVNGTVSYFPRRVTVFRIFFGVDMKESERKENCVKEKIKPELIVYRKRTWWSMIVSRNPPLLRLALWEANGCVSEKKRNTSRGLKKQLKSTLVVQWDLGFYSSLFLGLLPRENIN